jgi:alpha-ketoglutarate-dependent taurine dioxygenase
MSFSAIALAPEIGTEIKADKATLLAGQHAAEIRELLEQRGVLIFKQINFTNPEQVAFAKTLGDIIPQGEEGIFKVSLDKSVNQRAYDLRGAFYWHIDGANDPIPTRASLLSAWKLSDTGGQTEFANTYAAYDALSDAEKAYYDTLKVYHSLENSQLYVYPEPSYEQYTGWQQRHKPRLHPLVWTHQSGRKSLVLGSTASHVDGLDLSEGRLLLCKLRDWATQKRFVYRHEWTLGDLVIWDNTGTMHRVLDYPLDSGRQMHRTTLVGEEALV